MKKWMIMFLWMLAVPVMILAAGTKVEAETYNGIEYSTDSDGTAVVKKYSGTATELIIPESIGEYTVEGIGMWAFEDCDTLEKIIIPKTVLYLDSTCFDDCYNLKEIVVEDGNEKLVSQEGIVYSKDMKEMVRCPEGKTGDLIIPDSVEVIQSGALSSCKKIINVTVPENTDLGQAHFYGWDSLQNVMIAENHDTYISEDGIMYDKTDKELVCYPAGRSGIFTVPENVTTIASGAFSGNSLRKIYISSNVIEMEAGTFSGCNSLEEITVDDNNVVFSSYQGILYNKNKTEIIICPMGKSGTIELAYGITTIESDDFYGNDNITEIIFPDSLTSIGDSAFSRCEGITEVSLPENVKTLGMSAFQGCTSLKRIDLPSEMTYIGGYCTFLDCVNLTDITIPRNVTSIGMRVFEGCDNLREIKVDKDNTVLYEENGIVYNAIQKKLECCPGGISGVVEVPEGIEIIGAYSFVGCEKITEIILPTSIKELKEATFARCNNLKKIVIPVMTVELGEFIFDDCENLTLYSYKNSDIEKYVNSYGSNKLHFKNIDNTTVTTPGTEDNTSQSTSPTEGISSVNKGTSSVGAASSVIKTSKISLSGLSNKIAAGKKVQLTVTFTPSNVSNKNVIWTSSNPKVATVNQNGVVTFKKKSAGKSVIITATAADGSGAKAVFKLKSMKGVVKKVAISGAKKRTVKAGKALKLKAKVTATKGANKKLQWTSSNTKYATVSASGKVKTKKAGKGKTVKITAMATDGSGKKQVVKVKIK